MILMASNYFRIGSHHNSQHAVSSMVPGSHLRETNAVACGAIPFQEPPSRPERSIFLPSWLRPPVQRAVAGQILQACRCQEDFFFLIPNRWQSTAEINNKNGLLLSDAVCAWQLPSIHSRTRRPRVALKASWILLGSPSSDRLICRAKTRDVSFH